MIGSKQQIIRIRGYARRLAPSRRLAGAILLLSLLVLGQGASPIGAQELPWQPLSPIVDQTNSAAGPLVGAAPTWPNDHVLFTIYKGWLARTDDNGATWVRLPTRFAKILGFWPTPGVDQ